MIIVLLVLFLERTSFREMFVLAVLITARHTADAFLFYTFDSVAKIM